jgi:glycosyltransferase involved in cell wall biosynthesis
LIIKHQPFDVLNPHEWPASLAAAMIKQATGIPVVWMCNDLWHIPEIEQQYMKLKADNESLVYDPLRTAWTALIRKIRWEYDKNLTRRINAIIVLDHRIKKLIQQYYHCPSTVIRTGFDKERFEKVLGKKIARQQLKLPVNSFIFLLFGVMYPHRRYGDVLQALQVLKKEHEKKCTIVIAGEDTFAQTYAHALYAYIRDHQLEDQVIIRNTFIPFGKQYAYYSACDAFIFPNAPQTWGITPIEVMSLGKPCIISKGSGVSEVLKDGEHALLYEPGNIPALAAYMNLLMVDANLRKNIAHKARMFVRATFSWQNYTEQMEKIFKTTLKH